jgi:hypothetical protein
MSSETHDSEPMSRSKDHTGAPHSDGQNWVPPGHDAPTISPTEAPAEAFARLDRTAEANGGEYTLPKEYEGSFGRTLFDSPSSEDGCVTVVMAATEIEHVTAQALVRIHSYPDSRVYVGAVSSGPFYDPDGLRADSPTMVVSAVSGAIIMPSHHGRLDVSIIGLEHNGRIGPANRRPRPNSPVFVVPDEEMSRILGLRGDFPLVLPSGSYDSAARGGTRVY